jgi:hypothetical protein
MPDEAPLTTQAVAKIVQDQLAVQQSYLKFTQDQIDRSVEQAQRQAAGEIAFFERLFTKTIWCIGAVLAVGFALATFFGLNTLTQIREDARKAADAESVNVRAEVRKRIDDEFRSEQIKKLVREVAEDRTKNELQGVIRSEVGKGIQQQAPAIRKAVEDETKRSVRELEPTIGSIVSKETQKRVDESVKPVQERLGVYGEIIAVETLATLANANNRPAFDKLMAMLYGNSKIGGDARIIAEATVLRIIRAQENPLRRMGLTFKEKQTPETMKKMMTTSAFVNERLAALDNSMGKPLVRPVRLEEV